MANVRIPNIDELGNFLSQDVLDRLRDTLGGGAGAANEDALRWWWAQLGGAVTAPADVVVISDSTGEGVGAGARTNRWVDRLLADLRRDHQPAGVKGGSGYTPAIYSPQTVPNPWTYRAAPTYAQDTFTRTGSLSGSSPDIGPSTWNTSEQYTLDGSSAVAKADGTSNEMYLPIGTTADRKVTITGHIPSVANTNGLVVLASHQDGTNNALRLRGNVRTATSDWYLEKSVGGVLTTLATYPTPPIPAGASNTDYVASVTINGLTVTADVNGQTITYTLTEAEKTAVMGAKIGFRSPFASSKVHDITATSTTVGTVASPPILNGVGLGNRAINIGTGQAVQSAEMTFTGTGVDVFFAGYATTGTARVTVDGGAATTLATVNGTPGMKLTVRGLASGAHTLTVATNDQRVAFEGVMVYDGDESAGIRMWEASRSGARTAAFSNEYTWHQTLAANVVPDLAIVGLGLNDYNTGYDPALFRTNLETIIARLRAVNPDVSIVLHNSYLRGDTTTPAYPWQAYLDQIDALVAADPSLVLVDLNARMLGWSLVPVSLRTMWVADKVHPSPQGNGVMKDAIYRTVRP